MPFSRHLVTFSQLNVIVIFLRTRPNAEANISPQIFGLVDLDWGYSDLTAPLESTFLIQAEVPLLPSRLLYCRCHPRP